MSTRAQRRMTVDEFLVWAEGQDGPPVIHYGRQADGTILRSMVHEGALALSPPGIELAVAELFAAARS